MRRAPYAENPRIGERGQRTRQRIVDAALEAFAERGYHRCSIDTIAGIAGCSRVSFYQYFSGKEDLFRHLALEVSAALRTSTAQLQPITADADGWASLHAWAERYGDIYEHYRPVFHAFPAAVESDATLAEDSLRTYRRAAHIRKYVDSDAAGVRRLDEVLFLLESALPRALHDLTVLRSAAESAYHQDALLSAYTDVAHRTLFGLIDAVNVHDGHARLPRIPLGPTMSAAFDDASGTGGPARAAVLDAARNVFVERGYHGTRVDDIAEAAGVSHGALYRYFKNKDEVALRLAADAMRTISTTLARIPHDAAELAGWLRDYNRAQVDETAILRVWTDAALQDDQLSVESAAVLDWGRRRLMHFLEPRGFGNPAVEGVVLLSFLDAFGRQERSTAEIDAAADVLQRGFLGQV